MVKIIIGEALVIGVMSWILALLLSLPLTRVLGPAAESAHGASLPLTVSISAAAIWLGLVLVIAVAASATPALRAARLVVREALVYE